MGRLINGQLPRKLFRRVFNQLLKQFFVIRSRIILLLFVLIIPISVIALVSATDTTTPENINSFDFSRLSQQQINDLPQTVLRAANSDTIKKLLTEYGYTGDLSNFNLEQLSNALGTKSFSIDSKADAKPVFKKGPPQQLCNGEACINAGDNIKGANIKVIKYGILIEKGEHKGTIHLGDGIELRDGDAKIFRRVEKDGSIKESILLKKGGTLIFKDKSDPSKVQSLGVTANKDILFKKPVFNKEKGVWSLKIDTPTPSFTATTWTNDKPNVVMRVDNGRVKARIKPGAEPYGILLEPDNYEINKDMISKYPAGKDLEFIHKNAERISLSSRGGPSSGIGAGFRPPISGTISSGFGYRGNIGIRGASKNHKAIDIIAPKGTPVYPAMPGKVIFAGWIPGYGKTVQILHPDGSITQYAHLDKIFVSQNQNQELTYDQKLGTVGNTGLKGMDAHLDFKYKSPDGEWEDPAKILGLPRTGRKANGLYVRR